jgi:hypothetical protein
MATVAIKIVIGATLADRIARRVITARIARRKISSAIIATKCIEVAAIFTPRLTIYVLQTVMYGNRVVATVAMCGFFFNFNGRFSWHIRIFDYFG